MTSNAWLIRFSPLFLFTLLLLLAIGLQFNGLYGQDAHEYLRQSRAFFDCWTQGMPIQHTLGNAEFSSGYPIAGAILRFIVGDPIFALQVVSCLSFAVSAWLLERIIGMLSHGSRADSRLLFILLGLVLSPVFVRSGLVVMSDGLGLALTLAAFFFGLRWVEQQRGSDTVWAALFMALAVSVRIGLAGMLFPLTLLVGWYLLVRQQWAWMTLALLAGIAVLLPHFIYHSDLISRPFQHSMFQHWSPVNFIQRSFSNENGLSQYAFPNVLYIAFPLLHPYFCLTLPGLLLLSKKTDIILPAKKAILVCLGAYLLLLGGLPHQNLRFLLPAYGLLLLLVFPAWDRLYAYGLHFFRRLTLSVIVMTVLLQFIFCYRMVMPTLGRNHLEQSIAREIHPMLPLNASVYSFDLDIALQSYLPDVQFVNLWIQRYEVFPIGSFVLFNEPALRVQWAGQNPMLNWGFLVENYTLEVLKNLPEGWVLYEIKQRE